MLGRNLRFGRVASLGEDVFLQASGDARQGHGNVFGLVVEAKRDIGVIAGGDLSLPTVLFGGTYSLKAGRDLVVGVGGDLDLNGVAEAGRDLRFDIAGTVALQGVRAGRDVTINSGGAIHIDQFVEAVIAHEAAHLAVVDQHHRRIGASAEALALLQGEQAVGGGAAHGDAELVLQVVQRALAIAQLARQVGAYIELVLANWLLVIHVVESRDLVHGNRRHAEIVCNDLFAFSADKTQLFLNDGEAGHHGRLFTVCRIFGNFARKTGERLL
eukprot:gene43268-biopygen34502